MTVTKVGNILLFSEPEICPEVPYPPRERHISQAEADKRDHITSYSARTASEPTGWSLA